jgi:hypothetical protein
MIRRTITALLVALVASFALSSPANAATRKTARPRVKHSSHAATATRTKPAVKKKKAAKKKTAHSSTTAKKSGKTQKRKPTTKPH